MAVVRIALKIYWAQAAAGFAVGFIVPWLQFFWIVELSSTRLRRHKPVATPTLR